MERRTDSQQNNEQSWAIACQYIGEPGGKFSDPEDVSHRSACIQKNRGGFPQKGSKSISEG
jgi:hypothetical protein